MNNETRFKYNQSLKNGAALRSKRRDKWKSGPSLVEHDKYYAWLKHKAQARYRDETHDITWEQWQELWPDPVWFSRGRGPDCVTLRRVDKLRGWSMNNVVITKRKGRSV